MANQKFVHKVSPELTDDAQYKSPTDIESVALTQGTTILLYPGEYSGLTGLTWDDITIKGVGDIDEVIIHGPVTFTNTAANTCTFENIYFKGSNIVTTSDAVCVEFGHADDASGGVKPVFKECKFSNAEHAVRQHGATGDIEIWRVDAGGVNQAIVSNANCNVSFSILNLAANAYFAHGGGNSDGDATVRVLASHSGGSNTGSTIETVRALIS